MSDNRKKGKGNVFSLIARLILRPAAIITIEAGIGLAVASAAIEIDFPSALLGGAWVDVLIVIALESIKVGQFVFIGALWPRLGKTEKSVAIVLHALLVTISFLASLA